MWRILAIVYGVSEAEVLLARRGQVGGLQVAFAPALLIADTFMHSAVVVRKFRQQVKSSKKS